MSTLRRTNNWPQKLALFIEEKRSKRFDWSSNNCCFFACDWLAMLVGVDLAAEMRLQVNSALSAQRVLAERGGVDAIAREVCAQCGWPDCRPAMARRGDLVEVQTEQGPALGVCIGAKSIFPGPDGIEYRETLLALRAWRIA